jgi:hypothetical protein
MAALRVRMHLHGMFYCPDEGAEEFSPGFQPGFNPGNHQVKRFALKLKGREIVWANPTLIAPQKDSDKPPIGENASSWSRGEYKPMFW